MTSPEQPSPDPTPAVPPIDPMNPSGPPVPTVVPGGSATERAGALLRVRAFRRLWRAQLLGTVGDRLGLLVLVLLVVQATGAGTFGSGYRGVLFAIAALFAVRLLTTVLLGVLLLRPLARVLDRLDRRWTLFGADALRVVLLGSAPFWDVWARSTAEYWLLLTALLAAAAERVATVAHDAVGQRLLPAAAPGVPSVDQRPVLRHIDLWTGYTALPLAAATMVVLTLIENGLAHSLSWLDAHAGTVAGFGAAVLLGVSAVLLYLQELPSAPGPTVPHSPLAGLFAPTDTTAATNAADVTVGAVAGRKPGPAGDPSAKPGKPGKRGRTGSSVMFSFAATGAAAVMAGVVSVALKLAEDLAAGPVGFALLVLFATVAPLLGLRVAESVLPTLSRRRLLPLALATTALGVLLAGLVQDYVLALVLVTLAGVAAGVAVRTAWALLAVETEESRHPLVAEHLRSMLRTAVGVALVAVPLVGAAFGAQLFGTGHSHLDHGGAGLAISVVGLLLLVLAVVVFLRTDDRRGTASLSHDVWNALRGGAEPVPHRAGTGFFIALEGGDGAGKSTQAQALAEWIRNKGHEVVVTREPGGSAIGQRLRAMLLDVGNTGISHRAEALLYAADRAEHVETVIRPALERGAVVITDRYMDSSVAYQGAGRDLAGSEVARISRWAVDGLVPDLTVLLDVDPMAARERFTEALDRLESEPVEFHARVRAGFLALAAADPVRYLVVNAAQTPAAVTTAIRHRLDRELPLSEQERAARAEQERLARIAEERRIAEEARLKAEAEQAEKEKQALLERLRLEAEEQAQIARAEEDRRAAEAARVAAEEARKQALAEAAARAAAEEERREAEAAERRRQEAEAARLAELERQRDARRAEERRRAEDALRRAEEARVAAAAAAAAAAAVTAANLAAEGEAPTREIPAMPTNTPGTGAGARPDSGSEAGSEAGAKAGAAPKAAPQAAAAHAESRSRAEAGTPAQAERGLAPQAERRGEPRSGAETEARTAMEAKAGTGPEAAANQAEAEPPAKSAPAPASRPAPSPAPASKPAPAPASKPVSAPAPAPEDRAGAEAAPAPAPRLEPDQPTQVISEEDRAEVVRRALAAEAAAAAAAASATTVEEMPAPDRPKPAKRAPARRGRANVPPVAPEERTTVLPKVPAAPSTPPAPADLDQEDRSWRLPKSWRVAKPRSDESVQDRVPDWLFRPEDGPAAQPTPAAPPVERTREMPVVDPDAPASAQRGARYDWAEETPLDDLPSLTDELLGSREEWSQWDGGDGDNPEAPRNPRPKR